MRSTLTAACALMVMSAPAIADSPVLSEPDLSLADVAPSLALDTAAAYRQEPAPGEPPPAPPTPEQTVPQWGVPGSWWITIGGGVASNFDKDTDANLHVSLSTFVGTELEFALELGGWYFSQEGDDTGGFNPNVVFRWHFWHDPEFNWSFYGDAGIGLLFSADDVPSGGTSINFTPRVGFGYTHAIGTEGTRLQIGLRYHHISNGRVQGDDQNPSRDSLMIYFGVIFPL